MKQYAPILAAALLFAACSTQSPTVREAQALYNAGQYDKAIPLFLQEAYMGNSEAQLMLAKCCDFGHGVPQDTTKAAQWYRKAAENGNANAQNNLGGCFFDGAGVPKDYSTAFYWYNRAAQQGNASALNNVGLCYRNGGRAPGCREGRASL